MAHPLRKFLKNPKFDAVVSFQRPERSTRRPRASSSSTASPSGGRSSPGTSPVESRRERTPRPSSEGASSRIQRRRSSTSSRSGRSSRRSSAKDDGMVTSSVVAVLADKGSAAAKKNNYHVGFRTGASANRAERLQVRLNTLESEMDRLKLHEEQLEHRLKRFIRQKTALVNTIDDIHLKLEALTRSHKAICSSE